MEDAPVYGRKGRLGAIVPANNSVIEPEWWSALPAEVALYATRILAKGDLTPAAVHAMESNVDRAVDELAATGVDVIVYCDMVTTFIMEPGWNEAKVAEIEAKTKTPVISAWTALRDALTHLGISRFALGTPYPAAIHALAPPFFAARGYEVVQDATLDVVKMRDVPKISADTLKRFVATLDHSDAQAIVLLATDLPSFAVLTDLEQLSGRPVLTSNQTLLWSALRAARTDARIASLGRLFNV
jgi:maleate cis-trans isomerase